MDKDKIFDEAEVFIKNCFNPGRVKRNNFNIEKALIGTAGQLQKSGASNVVCIGQTDYLTKEKISADEQCIKIVSFFNQFIETKTK